MKRSLLILLLFCLFLLPLCAQAEATATDVSLPMAEDISKEVSFKGGVSVRLLTDGGYGKVWTSRRSNGESALTIIAPEDKTIGGISIRWRFFPEAITIQAPDGNGGWVDVSTAEGKYYEQFYPVDSLNEIRIIHAENPGQALEIYEITVLTPGEVPDSVHIWQDAPEKVDMMLLHGHPDDEVLWFGGLLPTYACEQEKDVLVVCSTPALSRRKQELLDSLWICGVRIAPVFCDFPDEPGLNMTIVLDKWDEDSALSFVTELYRKYKPDVVVTHDIHGEYGHGVHKALSYISRTAIETAADASCYPEQVSLYGVWDVPKMYIHLYEENQIEMNWWQPLSAFDGMTAQDVAREAFACHKSQQGRSWSVSDHDEYDNSLFGLYHTTVGLDIIGGDMFENIP